jgi:hypothetical protein
MLIRSQDKKLLINFDNMQSISICGYRVDSKNVHEDEENANTWYITCVSQDYSPFIGYYSTEAKAIKILDKICNTYAETCYTENTLIGENRVPTIISNNVIFQMPSDDEVEV